MKAHTNWCQNTIGNTHWLTIKITVCTADPKADPHCSATQTEKRKWDFKRLQFE